MKSLVIRALVALWLSFMVATVGPALFGDMLTWTGPVTCPGGKVSVQTDTYYPRPGETDTTRTPLCTSANGTTGEIPTLLSLVIIWGEALLPSLLPVLLLLGLGLCAGSASCPAHPQQRPPADTGCIKHSMAQHSMAQHEIRHHCTV